MLAYKAPGRSRRGRRLAASRKAEVAVVAAYHARISEKQQAARRKNLMILDLRDQRIKKKKADKERQEQAK